MTSRRQPRFWFCASVALTLFLVGVANSLPSALARGQANAGNNEKSLLAFRTVASVLTSPRCLNCHSSYDGPLQGDDHHPHAMNVRRGVARKISSTNKPCEF